MPTGLYYYTHGIIIKIHALKRHFVYVEVTVGFGSPGVSVQESSGQFMMCVVRDVEALQDITVTISSEDGTAIANIGT